MQFVIQASNPQSINSHQPEDDTLFCAIQEVFSLHTETAYIKWGYCNIPLSYKYELSEIINDLLIMLDKLTRKDAGGHEFVWMSSTFKARWDMSWRDDDLSIAADWELCPGHNQELLNARPELKELKLRKSQFISEWKRPLMLIFSALKYAGYTKEQVSDLFQLEQVLENMPQEGFLYGSKSLIPWD